MKPYVEFVLKLKLENTQEYSQAECGEINKQHEMLGFGFKIQPKNTRKNKGLRHLAKICLNSLWGKLGQNPGHDDFAFANEWSKMLMLINDPEVNLKTWHIVSPTNVEIRYSKDQDMEVEAGFINEAVAAFTTANARMRLYQMLDYLAPGQSMYCDSDSCVFYTTPTTLGTSRQTRLRRTCPRAYPSAMP